MKKNQQPIIENLIKRLPRLSRCHFIPAILVCISLYFVLFQLGILTLFGELRFHHRNRLTNLEDENNTSGHRGHEARRDENHFSFVLTPPTWMCEQHRPFLLIMVKSKVDHFEERQVVRKTWGHHHQLLLDSMVIRRVFLLGTPKPIQATYSSIDDPQHRPTYLDNKNLSRRVREEHARYGDLLQQDFYDAYHNNTLQTQMGLEWANDYCPQVFSSNLIHQSSIFNLILTKRT